MISREKQIKSLTLEIQVSKCWLSCQHCYAGDFLVSKQQMPLPDVLRCVDFFKSICSAPLTVYLYKDLLEYHAIEKFLQALSLNGLGDSVELLPTHGWVSGPIGHLDQVALMLANNGVKRVWLTIHGEEAEHDAFVRRRGAFKQLVTFAAAAKTAGVGADWNLLLRRSNQSQIIRLVHQLDLRTISSDFYFSVPGHLGYAKAINRDRPTFEVVKIFPELGVIPATTYFSEADWIRRILELSLLGTKPTQQPFAEIRVMPDLSIELHDFPVSKRIGNILVDTPEEILLRITAEKSLVSDIRCVHPSEEITRLCEKYGNGRNDEAHCVYSIVSLWAERAWKIQRPFIADINVCC